MDAGKAAMPLANEIDFIAVKVGDRDYCFASKDVAFISMAKDSINILGYPSLPRCVVAVASNNDRLFTVIDAAQLFDLGVITVDARARLIAFNHPELDAVMLLVNEITGRTSSPDQGIIPTTVQPEALVQMLQAVNAQAFGR
ncbi:MAG: hypothetical protein O9327_10600 [Polaromonas sp.]|nr:hypothetical protein [Polaromonas sp.]